MEWVEGEDHFDLTRSELPKKCTLEYYTEGAKLLVMHVNCWLSLYFTKKPPNPKCRPGEIVMPVQIVPELHNGLLKTLWSQNIRGPTRSHSDQSSHSKALFQAYALLWVLMNKRFLWYKLRNKWQLNPFTWSQQTQIPHGFNGI